MDNTLLSDEVERIKHARELPKGTTCRACEQFVKVYRRKFNSGMARSAILIMRLTERFKPDGNWIHVQKKFAAAYGLNANAMDYIQLTRWGLVEAKPNDKNNKAKRDPGLYRLTENGSNFCSRGLRVPRKIFIYNNKTIGHEDGDFIGVVEALGEHFDYNELMTS